MSLNLDRLSASLEYLSDYAVFERLYAIRRTSDLQTKVADSGPMMVLPKQAMLHLVDNISHIVSSSDTFDVTQYPFINNKSNLRYLSHFMDFEAFDKDDLAKFTHRVYRPKLFDNVRQFSRDHRSILIPAPQLEPIIDNKAIVIVENYNPLYRLIATNSKPIYEYNRYRTIMSVVLKNITKYPERNNFLVVPIPKDYTYARANFMGLISAGKVSAQRLLGTDHFQFLMLDILALLITPDSDLSTFKVVNNRVLNNLNVMLTHGEKSIIFNLGTLITLADNKTRAFSLIDCISNLSRGIVETNPVVINETEDKLDESIEPHNDAAVEKPEPIMTATKETFEPVEVDFKQLLEHFSEVNEIPGLVKSLIKTKAEYSCYAIKSNRNGLISCAIVIRNRAFRDYQIDHPITIITMVYTKEAYRRQGHSRNLIVHILETNELPVYLVTKKTNNPAQNLYKSLGFIQIGEGINLHADKYVMRFGKESEASQVVSNFTDSKPSIPYSNDEEIDEIDDGRMSTFGPDEPTTTEPIDDLKDVNKFIKKQIELTPKQMARASVLAERYKVIKVKGPYGQQTINDVISNPPKLTFAPAQLTQIADQVVDKSMAQSSTKVFDSEYQEKVLRYDIINSVVAFKDHGLFLTGYEEINEYSSFTRVKYVRASFEDIRGKRHTVKFKLPMPDDEGYYLVNGIKLSMSKQLVNLPICKISPTRVSLISNYNKTLVDKVQSSRNSLPEYIAKNADKLNLKLVPKTNSYIGIKLPFEYKLLGSKFAKITTADNEFYFEYVNRYQQFAVAGTRSMGDIGVGGITKLEAEHGVLVGKVLRNKDEFIFMNDANLCTTVNIATKNIVSADTPITSFFGSELAVPFEWCDLKILDKNIPIIFILAYRYGLSTVLKHIKTKHRFVASRQPFTMEPTEMALQFKDGRLILDRYPLLGSYILAGLASFSTLKQYSMGELDDKDTFYHLLADKGMSLNYLKGIDNHFDFFIDPITKDVLTEMHEPTNTKDLLIRAVEMLVSEPDKVPSALSNFRLRSAEKLPAIVYNEISRQYANYINSNFKDVSFSINTEAVFQRIIQDQTMGLREDINPIHAMKDISKVTYTGFGGRSSEAFVEKDRRYPKDAIGILAETTTDSASVGMVSALTGDPKIKNLRGMFDTESVVVTPTNSLSDTTLLMPGVTHDDPKRANFTSIILSHHIPTKNLEPCRMRTGYELVVPQKTTSFFAAKAKTDGKVIAIDDSLKMITVKYRDTTTDVFEYGEIKGDSSGMMINHDIRKMPGVKVGAAIKSGDVITYHADFFKLDPVTEQLSWCHGVPATVAIMAKDVTLEDSNMITAEFASKMGFDSIYSRPIHITSDMVVDSHLEVGTNVVYNDVLIRLSYEGTASIIGTDVDELFSDLKQVEYRSKNEGVITDIKVFHVTDELNTSLQKFVNKISYRDRRKANLTKGTRKETNYATSTKVPVGTRIGGIQLGESDVLIVFYIKSNVALGVGDKIIFDSSLKSVVGRVEHEPIETEDGENVDAIFGANSIGDRIVMSPYIVGICDRIIKHAEQEVVSMYFDDKK